MFWSKRAWAEFCTIVEGRFVRVAVLDDSKMLRDAAMAALGEVAPQRIDTRSMAAIGRFQTL